MLFGFNQSPYNPYLQSLRWVFSQTFLGKSPTSEDVVHVFVSRCEGQKNQATSFTRIMIELFTGEKH
jgi:hypothetical protein